MSKYVPDIASKRWVIIAPNRTQRPEETGVHAETEMCPFCPGNEKLAGEEVFRIGGGDAEFPGWKVRVLANKYPITDFHEVIIHTPDDDKHIGTMDDADVELVFRAYRQRYNAYKDHGNVIIFCNHGTHAGASIKHSHSQLVVIPSQITLDALSREPITNVVQETTHFQVYCPDFSQWPYELWIAPRKVNTVFGEATDEELGDLARLTKAMIQKIEQIHNKGGHWITEAFGYNYYLYSKQNWFLRLIPRFVHRAGFELGSGLSVNVVDPIEAAKDLKK